MMRILMYPHRDILALPSRILTKELQVSMAMVILYIDFNNCTVVILVIIFEFIGLYFHSPKK